MSSTFSDPSVSSVPPDPPARSVPSQSPDSVLFSQAFDASPTALLLIDPASRKVLAANRCFFVCAGVYTGEVVGIPLANLPIFRDRPELCAACDSVAPGESISIGPFTVAERETGERQLELTVTGFSIGPRVVVQCSLADVSARWRLDRRSRQMEKMESLRLLAGTAAHDFNNMLTCVRGYVSVALETRALPADVREILGHVKGATTRAGEFTQRLLGFSRRRKLQLQTVELGSFLRSLAPQLQATLPLDIRLVVFGGETPVAVPTDPALLRTVLESLVKNAREAMGESGQITLSVAETDEPGLVSAGHPASPGGRFARLSVQDDGCGMSPAVQARLFEPAFTTKKSGGASGTSLAHAYSIVADHGGWFDVRTAEGCGSTFTLVLPLTPR